MAVLGFPFEEAYREMDRLLDAAGGTGKWYGRNFQSGVRLLPGDDALAKEAVAAALAEANAASVKAAQDADAALEAELFSRIR